MVEKYNRKERERTHICADDTIDTSFKLLKIPQSTLYPHFIDEKIQEQRGKGICPWSSRLESDGA